MSAHASRMARAAESAGAAGLACVVVGPSPDMTYLTGYSPPPLERPTLLALRPGEEPVLVVPRLEQALASKAPGADAMHLVGWSDQMDPYGVIGGLVTGREGPVGVNDRLWAAHLLELRRAAPDHEMVSAAGLLGALRTVKDAEEIAALRRAGAAADATFEEICATRFAGRTEHAVATELGRLLVSHGHSSADLAIVASGPNSASPHHEPGERTLSEGDTVVMDFGGVLDGYCSDTTRTVSIGEPNEELVRIHEVVRGAQEAGVAAVHPGVAAQDVDRAARRVIEEAGYGDSFFHRTGHGIGIEVHEHPYIVEGNDEPLRVGTTFSVEPGIYLEGRFGVRIEDIVVVTEDGAERLNLSSRELRVVS